MTNQTDTIEEKIEELKEKAKAIGRIAGLPAEACTLYDEIGESYFEKIRQVLTELSQQQREQAIINAQIDAFKWLLSRASGGGNWRRLCFTKIAELEGLLK